MGDIKSFLIKTAEQYFGIQNAQLGDKADDSISEFVHNPQQLHVQTFVENDTLQLYTEIRADVKKSLIFYKMSAQELTGSDVVAQINIITLSNAPAESLYHVLKQVYTPMLLLDNNLISNKLQENLSDLESNLRILTHNKDDSHSVNVIMTISDEIDYWKNVAKKKASKKETEGAAAFSELFADINEEIRSMQTVTIPEVREAAENVGGLLDDVWRLTTYPYAQERMKHVLDIIGHSICSVVQRSLSLYAIWAVHSAAQDTELLLTLADSLKVLDTWTGACRSLTETYWPNYALHAWTGKPCVPAFCANFQRRLKEVHDIRSTHNQLNKLLNNNERIELQTDQMFEPFQNINVWICTGSSQVWETAVAKFSVKLRPAEAKIAEKLRPRLHNTSTKQMLYEFMRYRSLLTRPHVKAALHGELRALVTSLAGVLRGVRARLHAGDVGDGHVHRPPEMSPVVQQAQWAKQTEAKVADIRLCAEQHLSEFEGSAELLQLAAQVLQELKSLYTQLHEDWSRDLQAQVKNGALQLSLDQPVVEFSSASSMMVVQFNPRTVSAGAEARDMAALGLPPPPLVRDAIDKAARMVQYARQLQQVASFHNSLGARMVPSTRPMLLAGALELSALVQRQRGVCWQHAAALADLATSLAGKVQALDAQNSYLTSQHVAIRSIVVSLVDTELLAQQAEWKKKVNEIRDIIERVEANGYASTSLWRAHWDRQLYKALECQYVKTLRELHRHFPSVRVDLVLRGHSVRLQPPLEEIRVQHYRQLRRFISLPAQFVGLQDTLQEGDSIFKAIVDKHSWMGNKSVGQLERTLASLSLACASWSRRAALACAPDVRALCREYLSAPEHWEMNFKACKAYGQAVAKMTFDDEKIDWISVGTISLRREFEAQVRNLWACLISSLQESCRDDATNVDSFIANAMVTLENKILPKNAKELAEISAKQRALKEKMPEMEKTVEDLKKKGHMLRTWGGDPTADSTLKEWLKIHELMRTHQQMFEQQAEIVKSSLSGEWENLHASLEAWLSRRARGEVRGEALGEARGATYDDMTQRGRAVADAAAQWERFVAERDELVKECQKFDMPCPVSDSWSQAEKMMSEDTQLWSPLREFDEEYQSLAQQEWIVFQKKLHLIDELVSKWTSKLEPFTTVTLFLQQELEKYSDLTPLLKYLRGSDFTERHWREVYSLLEMDFKKPDTLLVKDLLSAAMNIKKHIKALQKISQSACCESAVRSALNELELWFAGARLTVVYYTDKAGQRTPIVKDFKEILSKIEEQQWIVGSLGGGGGGDACAAWESRLRAARTLLRSTHHVQRRWLYLEPILSNDEGELGGKFRKVAQGWQQVARTLEADCRLSALLQSARLQSMLDAISEQLLSCHEALNHYIDEKRSIFPRLYFLSDDDLLELLGQARSGAEGRAAVMQTHLKKLFPGMTGVRLGPDGMSITALQTHHDETLQLRRAVDIDTPVEIWLNNLETEMRSTIKETALKCVVTNSLQEQDPFSFPTQILCLAQNIRFTEQAERAIAAKDLHKLKSSVEKENIYYTQLEVDDENERNKRQALILQCACYLAVIRTLIESNVVSTGDWLWQKQLRFYLLSNKEIVIKMGLAQLTYGYEYLGVNTGQFVRTELADECFLILTQALHLGLVGNPFGPAGTGKTESVKALGGLAGRLVLVFNCDEAMDAGSMGRLLSGLARCGAWGCFDELNRLTADTLAAVSHQFAALLAAMAQGRGGPGGRAPTAVIHGKEVAVSEWCGVAATMNPVGRGYGGRRALPAALERLLRPVAMMSPRAEELARHLLAARAVKHADALAEDLYRVFTMSSTLLTEQRHYDWGLRALKAAVGSCGAALAGPGAAGEPRAALRRVLTLNNSSKLTRGDKQRFEAILSMVFADVPEEETSSNPISTALEETVKSLGLVHNTLQSQKCLELYEQLQQRMGVVIVGPPGSGKSTIRQLLKNVLTQQGKNIVEYIICPKAMSRVCLLGNIDHDTRQWTDGVISSTALEISNQSADVWSWVVCDGDIDPEWIEALNSVLDDNRLLTLPSGWRIQFPPNVNFIFETHSLEHASPATVSRMGIILLSDEDSCAHEMLQGWLDKVEIENEMARLALPLLQKVIHKSLQWIAAHGSNFVMKVYKVSVVKQIVTQFEYIAQNLGVSVASTSPEELIYVAVQRGVVGLLKQSAVRGLQDEMSELLGLPPASSASPAAPASWHDGLYLSQRLARVEPAVRAVIAAPHAHLLVVGPSASAKNLLAEYVLKDFSASLLITVNCTPVLEPADVIQELKRHNVVRSGGLVPSRGGGGGGGGGGGARATLLVRSLHRARVDAWRSSPVHSLLLQIIQYGGFWEQTADSGRGVQWCSLQSVRVVATLDPTAGAAKLCPRLSGALCAVALLDPDDEELLEMADSYLRQSVDKNVPDKDLSGIARSMLAVYKEISEAFYSQPHYKWTASDMRKWCENVKWYSPNNTAELHMAITAEANNIFKDRLATDNEKAKFNTIMRSSFKEYATDGLFLVPRLRGSGVHMEAVGHGDWYQIMQKSINQCLTEQEYNVFGDCGLEVCHELAVLCPAFARATNGGVVVCVGGAGVGRRAAAHVVATSLPATLIHVNHANEFNSQFKNALASSGTESNRTLVLVSETAANFATLGAIEALHKASSAHALPRELMPSLSHAQPTQQFIDNVKQYLGIIIALDKDQDDIYDLLEKYPILHTDSHMLWMERWSDDTLRQMPQLVIQRLIKEDITETSNSEHSSVPVEGFISIYNSLDADWSTAPCRYVRFIHTYYHIVRRKRAALAQRQNMLSSGVEALRRARSSVAALRAEAAVQETELADKQARAGQALDQISATVRSNTDQREEMRALKVNIEKENEKLQIRKKEIEAELASVEPVIAAARAAVGDIRSESLSEVRSLRAPPDAVRDVLEGVLRLMGIADTSWHSMKHFLSKRGVKEDIRCLDASQITPEAVESVQKLLARRGASFEDKTARRASAACAPLAAWVRANVAYAGALARVQPLQRQQADLMKNLRDAEDQLSSLSSGLASVESRVTSLKAALGAHTRDACALELRVAANAAAIETASKLLGQLAHEYTTWETTLEHISQEMLELNVRSLLAAAYIVYLPDVTEPQARSQIEKWSDLLEFDASSFSVIDFLSTAEKQLKWDSDGLPSDQSAIKNAVLIDQILDPHKCGFTPLIIDPDGDAIGWLKSTLADVSCDFISQYNDKLHTAIQYAVRLGRVLVVTDVYAVHPSWAPLLRGLPVSGANTSHAAVRLLLYTRDATLPHRLLPQHRATLSLVHFTARVDGLTDQLVHYALQQQNPEVNEKAREIKLKKAVLQKQQYELQENLLKDLSSNSDILHDTNLLASLNKTRESSTTIAESLHLARTIEEQTKQVCDTFHASAKRTAILTLAVKELTNHRPLVALPVDAALEVFVDGVRRGGDNDVIVKYVTRRIIERVLLGLHKKDKYIVALHLLQQVYDNMIPYKLWRTFTGIIDYVDDQKSNAMIKEKYAWIPDECVRKAAMLQATCPDLFSKLNLDNTELWTEFQKQGDLNSLSRLKLSQFETVVAVAVLRPESLYRAIVAFVDHLLGAGVMSRGGGDEAGAAAACGGARPLLLLGAHAADQLAARAQAGGTPLVQTGIEDGRAAWESALERARGGSWLALIVGASPFTAELRGFLTDFAQRQKSDFSPEFRLWIVSEDREIPPLISNACVNIVLEAPEGVQCNVLGTLGAWGAYSSADVKLVRARACLAYLHAVLQERRAYVPEGWSRWYPFEWGDVSACSRALLSGGAGAAARGLCSALYGGRVACEQDRKLLVALVDECLGEHVHAHAWSPRGTAVRLPFAKQLQAYASALSAMPSIDTPAMLALPANCRVAWESKAADNIVNGLRELSTAVSARSLTDDAGPLRQLLALWKQLMAGSPLVKGDYQNEKMSAGGGGGGGWWGCVCCGELYEAARAVRTIHTALATMARQRNYARGTALLEVPEAWQLVWAGPAAPDQYVRELAHRAHEAVARADRYTPGDTDYFPTELDLRSFLRPARVLAAGRARAAQALRCAPARLALSVAWDSRTEVAAAGAGALRVSGLRLSGARWAAAGAGGAGALAPVTSQAPRDAPAPTLTLTYVQSREPLAPESLYPVPVYSGAARDQLLLCAPAPLSAPLDAHTALLNSVALYVARV